MACIAPRWAWAASCCGGGLAAPALIGGEERARYSLAVGQADIAADVSAEKIWRDRELREVSKTVTIEGAHIFRDRFQAGASMAIVERSRAGRSSSGFGDSMLNFGYEYLPDWDYNPYRPKGLAYLQLIVPTGRSVYESEDPYLLDSRGRGFWAVGAGSLLSKIWGPYSGFVNLSVHRSIPTETLRPGWGGSLGIGGGFRFSDIHLGAGLSWNYEDPISVRGSMNSSGAAQRFADASISMTYFGRANWSSSLTLQDQTLFGTPTNTTLSRGILVKLERQIPR